MLCIYNNYIYITLFLLQYISHIFPNDILTRKILYEHKYIILDF